MYTQIKAVYSVLLSQINGLCQYFSIQNLFDVSEGLLCKNGINSLKEKLPHPVTLHCLVPMTKINWIERKKKRYKEEVS